MKSPDEMRQHLIEKADGDDDFRSKLLSDPRASIEEEFGITIPEGLSVHVHENTAQKVHLVLPPSPKLSQADLEATSGGATAGWCCY